jgi:hypothetical protein
LDRALLVRDVFYKCIEARIQFNSALSRCAAKGWPDRKAAIGIACRAQEAMLTRLTMRLNYLVEHSSYTPTDWASLTSTALVHERTQESWRDRDEAALKRIDVGYIALNNEIEDLKRKADPVSLEAPYAMARRDAELIAAANLLDRTIRALDERLIEGTN